MANLIKQLKDKEELTNKQVGELLGVCATTVSTWLNNPKKVPLNAQAIITKRLGVDPPKVYECELERVTLSEAAQRTGLSEYLIKYGLREGKFPFGVAIQGDGNTKYSYIIFRGKFEKFISENKVTKTS